MGQCPGCGTAVPQTPGKRARKWCSDACRIWKLRHPDEKRQPVRSCAVCGTDISSKQQSAKVCSKRCNDVMRGTARAEPLPERHCVDCGNAFTPRSSRSKRCSACAMLVHDHPNWPPICHDCGQKTERRSTASGRFCDRCSMERRVARYISKNHRRRTQLRFTDITADYERALRKRAGRCPLCSVWMTSRPGHPNSKHLDHIIPIAIGGTHTVGNVRIICRTCNLTRPTDGSDLAGHQPTLWAQDLTVVEQLIVDARPKTIRFGPRICRCGRALTKQSCRDCPARLEEHQQRVELGREAARMRADGRKWREIAEALGLRDTGAAYHLAWQYGDPDVRALWPRNRGWIKQDAA